MKVLVLFISILITTGAFGQVPPKPDLVWGMNSGTPNISGTVYEILHTPQNKLLISGARSGVIDIDFGPAVNEIGAFGSPVHYFAEYDTSGNLNWEVHYDGAPWTIYQTELNDAGDIFIFGGLGAGVTMDLDPGPGVYNQTYTESTYFLLQLDSAGNFVDVDALITPQNYVPGDQIRFNSMHIDDNQNIYIGGFAHGEYDLNTNGTPTIFNAPNQQTGFVVKYDVTGAYQWHRAYDKGWVFDVYTDVNENVLIGGLVKDSMDFDFGPGTDWHVVDIGDSTSSFLHKLDPMGNHLWKQTTSEGIWNHVMDITSNDSGDIFTTRLEGMSLNGGDLILHRLDSAGNLIWQRTIESIAVGFGRTKGIKLDPLDNVFIGGEYLGIVDFDPDPFVQYLDTSYDNTQYIDNFVLKLDSAGNFVWEFSVGGYTDNLGSQDFFALDDNFNVYLYRNFYESTDIDPSPNDVILTTGFNYTDDYLMKYQQGPCGNTFNLPDSVVNVSCSGPGFIATTTHLGTPPYTYQWNNTPPSDSSNALVTSGGIYQVEVTDALGCTLQSSYLVNEPSTYTGYDLQINAINTTFIAGQPFDIWIDASNAGCTPQSGEVSFVLSDAMDPSYSTSIPPTQVNGDTLFWDFASATYSDPHMDIFISGTISQNALLGATTCYNVSILPDSTDINPLNNIKEYCEVIVAAYDPNYKEVYPAGECEEHYTQKDETLTYTVHFQNTGTYQAFDIRVRDTIDPNLDASSIRVIAESDPMYVEVFPNNVVDFRFDNINLPDSTSNEPESHGYFIFEIDPLPGLSDNTIVENNVAIYFDFNAPIFTNTVFNTYIDTIPSCFLGLADLTEDDFNVYPNPSDGVFTIDFDGVVSDAMLSVFSLDGRLVHELTNVKGAEIELNLEGQQAGIYWITISGDINGTKKIVIN